VIVAAWALSTRLLHWDGLADVADGFWGSHDRARRLEIMSDSHTGAFGATAITLVALIEVSAIATVISAPHEVPLLFVPVFARASATAAAWFGKPARPGGLGRSVMGRPTLPSVVVACLTVGAAALLCEFTFRWEGVVIALLGIVLALSIPHLLSRRFGGVTGDVMGASVLLTETLLLIAFALGG
jgi:adenosylcobinamide-GDP ribazoletransferase